MRRRSIDIEFGRARVAIFVDGCFWHGCPSHGSIPRSNTDWWADKIKKNVDRDTETAAHLTDLGWLVLRFWEHEDPQEVAQAVHRQVLGRRSAAVARGPRVRNAPL